jgi:hypothetical protein
MYRLDRIIIALTGAALLAGIIPADIWLWRLI